MADYIYIILDEQACAVKIGYSNDPVKRLATLQTAHSTKVLRILTTFEGGRDVEATIHINLEKHRLSGEWFEFNEEVKNYILDKYNKIFQDVQSSPFRLDQCLVETICQEYLRDSKTKKRTRVPMKYLRANIQIPLSQLKAIMKENNYSEWKDKSKTVYYYKDEN